MLCSVYDGLLCRHSCREPYHFINKHFKHGRGAFSKGCLKRGPSAGAGKYSCSLDKKKLSSMSLSWMRRMLKLCEAFLW